MISRVQLGGMAVFVGVFIFSIFWMSLPRSGSNRSTGKIVVTGSRGDTPSDFLNFKRGREIDDIGSKSKMGVGDGRHNPNEASVEVSQTMRLAWLDKEIERLKIKLDQGDRRVRLRDNRLSESEKNETFALIRRLLQLRNERIDMRLARILKQSHAN